MAPSIQEHIARIVEPLARAAGLELWGIECFVSGRTLVRVYVDTPAGVGAPVSSADGALREEGGTGPSIDQCALISRQAALALDAEDLFPHAYVLELSSPGLARVFFSLGQLAAYKGSELEVELLPERKDASGRKRMRGRLAAVEQEEFVFVPENAAQMRIAWAQTRRVRLAPELPFSDRVKPGKKKAAGGAKKEDTSRKPKQGIPCEIF